VIQNLMWSGVADITLSETFLPILSRCYKSSNYANFAANSDKFSYVPPEVWPVISCLARQWCGSRRAQDSDEEANALLRWQA
jgi:hypothetical protein